MNAGGVSLECAPPAGTRIRGDRDALASAFLQICNSIRGGCESGGVLALYGGVGGDGAEVVFAHRGHLTPPRTTGWRQAWGFGWHVRFLRPTAVGLSSRMSWMAKG